MRTRSALSTPSPSTGKRPPEGTGSPRNKHTVDLTYSSEDEAFRKEIAAWMADALTGEFAGVKGRGGPGDEHALFEERLAWEKKLGAAGWTCVGWPKACGARELPFSQQVIFYEEYARAGGPGRVVW